MAKDYIGYQALTDAALRGVVRDALRRVEKQGLIASHHFYLTFKTHFAGVDIPDFLREQYPDEMTIILQHQFWGLVVKDDFFEVTLTFKKVPATLHIPFAALTAFADPGVQFGLQFTQIAENDTALEPPAAMPTAIPVKTDKNPPEPPPPAESEKPAPGEVVSLDSFRKK
ncbi:MAG TPA: ClpXP protease specificity-enhancing factor SspB [Rhizomicrobium sp.]|nr:ClpXP protease specificity-enhancing factor SspB [Rhizomicrobium sp.]